MTSVVGTVVSESTLLIVYGAGWLGATAAAVVANLAGTVPSYAMSRYWIWPEADRSHAARQMVAYWAVSVVSLVISSAAVGVATAHAPEGKLAHLVVAGGSYVGIYAVMWLAKFVIYQRVLFRPAWGVGVPQKESASVGTEPS